MGKITQLQIYMLFSLYLFTTILGFRIGSIVKIASYSTWLCILIGGFLGWALAYASYRLAIKRPAEHFVLYGRHIVGKWLHYPIVLAMALFFVFTAAVLLRELQDFLIQIYLLTTPSWAVSALFAFCIACAVRSGIGVIFRSAQGVFFMSIAGILIVPLFVHNEIDPDMTVALWNHFNVPGLWDGSLFVASLYGETAFILFLFPYFARQRKTMRSLAAAVVTSVIIILSNFIPALLIFGPDLMGNLTYPELELIRYIRLGAFLENLDPLIIVLWLVSLFVKISLLLFLAVNTLAQTFSLTDHKPFTLSVTALMVGFSLYMAETTIDIAQLGKKGMIAFLLIVEMIPLLYLAVDLIRSPRRQNPDQT
ncbi:GerAB/ArcD/ProY family transporter [Paenibacillus elgii]|uniref:GerAB/ArcD/ProY family transporter n=1 Tax=Paenibacillus elgii TaxID=189691 RepID=UPI00203ED084|nr:GerAB/ArcD/ProY family transporter [Paenibacillus elgii]MCM3269939.1 spore germination protein [Paenibacillus elgii]